MNTYVITRITPKKAARLLSAIYGCLFLLLSLFAISMFILVPKPPGANQTFPAWFGMILIVIYLLMGAFMGWISGHIGARIYNFAALKLGGLQVDIEKIA